MSDYKCPCSSCGTNIAFPEDYLGQHCACPNCGAQTVLTRQAGSPAVTAPARLSPTPPPAPTRPPKAPAATAGHQKIMVTQNGQQYGPYTLEEVNRLLASGDLSVNDLAWHEGAPGWIMLAAVAGVTAPAPKPSHSKPPSPPTQSPVGLGSGSKVAKRPNYAAEATAFDKETVKAGWTPQKNQPKPQQTGSSAWKGIGSLISTLFVIGSLVWFFFLESDGGAEHLIRQSMEETFTKDAAIPKPVKVTQVVLRDGPDQSRTGTAQVSVGARAVSIELTATITRSGGSRARQTQAAWEVSALEMAKLSGTSPAMQLRPARLAPAVIVPPRNGSPPKMASPDPALLAEAKQADVLIAEVDTTEDAVAALWNRGVEMDVGGQAQLQLIRDVIVPQVRATKNRVEQFQPSSAKLRPVRAAMLVLVQHDFSSWIAINNAAATGNWPLAEALFGRMERDRKTFTQKLEASVTAATAN